ncbi:MAG: hypothetical protein AAF799_13090 [Myxococcota bacterium]
MKARGLVGGIALVFGAGCGVDLIVGGTPEASTGAAEVTGAPEDTTDPASPAEDTSASSRGSSTGTDAPATSTGMGEPGTGTTGGTTTDPVGEEGTTTGEGSDCEGLGFRDCSGLRQCLWDGDPELGVCVLNPCVDPMNECLELDFEFCLETPTCAWVGEPKLGECGSMFCVPCEVLQPAQCEEVADCMWIEGKEACVQA